MRSIEKKIDQLIDRLIETTSDTVIAAYEKRVRDLEIQKALANEKIANCGRPLASFGETYRTAMEFLANPWKLWRSDRLEDRRAVLKLVFAERLPYDRKNGYRTGEISMPFKLLGDMKMHKSEMVRVGRYASNPITGPMIDEMKEKYRQHIVDKAGEARIEGEAHDGD